MNTQKTSRLIRTAFLPILLGLSLLMLPTFTKISSAQSNPTYIEILRNETEIRATPSITAAVQYRTWKWSLFEVLDDTNPDFYKIRLYNLTEGWVQKKQTGRYKGIMPPPIEKVGIVYIDPSFERKKNELNKDKIKELLNQELGIEEPAKIQPIAALPKPTIAPFFESTQNQITTPTATTAPVNNEVATEPATAAISPPAPIIRKTEFEKIKTPQEDWFRYPPKPKSKYPDLDIQGFYEAKYSGRDYQPQATTSSLWETIRKDPVYNKLPRDVLLGNPKFDIRYQFNIDGKLDDDLSVHYDVEQEPDFPGKYDIQVKYKKTELTFYHFDAEFQNGEFINFRKALDGAKIEHKDDNWSGIIATGRLRSDPQKFESYGNGSDKINVGRSNLLNDSVKVWVNNILLKENQDYTVNYYEGSITFKKMMSRNDYIEVVYEFTNPIEDFIPVLSRKNFFGAQYLWQAEKTAEETKIKESITETIVITSADIQNKIEPIFYLKNTPIVLGSDLIELNDYPLKKGQDYTLKHINGKLTIQNIALQENDTLKITYEYYQAEHVTDQIVGTNSPGPYTLSKSNILDGSVIVYVNQDEMSEARDYILDYDTGRLRFNFQVDYPKIITVEYDALKTDISTANTEAPPMHLGVTYLQEYARSQKDEMEINVPSESRTITSNPFFTIQNPLRNTADIVLVINGHVASKDEYEVVNSYKGEIRLTKETVSEAHPAQISIKYTYGKSFKTNYQFYGKTGKNGNDYLSGTETFLIRDLPIKYKGLEYIKLQDGSYLQENREYTIDYGEDGNTIKLKFRISSDGDQSSQLPAYPDDSTQMTLFYSYAPETSPDPGDIQQNQVGLTYGTKLNKNWTIDTEVSAANHNFSKPRKPFKDVLTGNGNNDYYNLSQRPIVENSESIFIVRVDNPSNTQNVDTNSGRSYALRKDIDYIINYIQGKIKFIKNTPLSSDTILVYAEYYDQKGITEGGAQQNFKLASSVKTEYKNEDITVKGDYKSIDKNFMSIAPIKEAKGTTVLGGSVDLKLNRKDNLFMDYHRKDEYKGQENIGRDSYLHTDDFKSKGTFFLFEDAIKTEQSVRYLLQVQDPFTTTGDHTIDDRTIEYESRFIFGPEYFKNTISRGFSTKISDYLDEKLPATSKADNFRAESEITLKKLFILGDTYFNPTYEQSNNFLSQTNQSITTTNATTQLNSSQSRTKKAIHSTYKPTENLDILVDLSIDEDRSHSPYQATDNLTTLKNEHYQINYNPFSWLQTGYDKYHRESESPLVNQIGEISDQQQSQIKRFAPMGMLTWMRFKQTEWYFYPIMSSYFTYQYSDKKTLENNNQREYYYTSQFLTYNDFKPLPGLTIQRMGYERRHSDSTDLIQTQTTSSNYATSMYRNKDARLSFTPPLPILNLFAYNWSFEDRIDTQTSYSQADSNTSNTTERFLPMINRVQSIQFSPGPLIFEIPKFIRVDFGRFSASAEENWKDITNTQKTLTYSANDKINPSLIDNRKDNAFLRGQKYNSHVSPFNLFNLDGIFENGKEEYSRNMYAGNEGYTLKYLKKLTITGDYSPFSFLKFDGGYARSKTYQFRSQDTESNPDLIEKAYSERDFSSFTDYLQIIENEKNIGAYFSPFSFVSLRGKGILKQIEDYSVNTSADIHNIFNQKTGSAGIVFYPLPGLSMSYDYSLIFTRKNDSSDEKGYMGNTNVTYTPIKEKYFSVNIQYNRTDTWGRELNKLDQQNIVQGTGDTITTQIVDRNDIVETGSLNIDITIPMTNSPYIDSFVITGEGYLKKISDKQDEVHRRENQPENSYEISGFVIKGTLLF